MKYPELTSGYLGRRTNQMTLNSAFWSRFDPAKQNFEAYIRLPQRVPRPDFFKELFELESKNTRLQFQRRYMPLLRKHKILSRRETLPENEAMVLLNLERILIRLGQYQIFENSYCPQIKNDDIRLKIALVRLSAQTYMAHARSSAAPVAALTRAWQQTKKYKHKISTDTQVEAAIRLIVYTSRYSNNTGLKSCTETLVSLIKTYKPQDSHQWSLLAMAYRALPMSPYITKADGDLYLLKMKEILDLHKPKDKMEAILWKELRFTSLQTLSKWAKSQGQITISKLYLLQMKKIDPQDSTIYSELGLFLFHQNKFKEAKTYFQKAFALGPPATSMNAYFLGLCELELGSVKNAIKDFEKSQKNDATAISPLLCLVDLYPPSKANSLRRYILSNKALCSQLDHEELVELKGLVK